MRRYLGLDATRDGDEFLQCSYVLWSWLVFLFNSVDFVLTCYCSSSISSRARNRFVCGHSYRLVMGFLYPFDHRRRSTRHCRPHTSRDVSSCSTIKNRKPVASGNGRQADRVSIGASCDRCKGETEGSKGQSGTPPTLRNALRPALHRDHQ